MEKNVRKANHRFCQHLQNKMFPLPLLKKNEAHHLHFQLRNFLLPKNLHLITDSCGASRRFCRHLWVRGNLLHKSVDKIFVTSELVNSVFNQTTGVIGQLLYVTITSSHQRSCFYELWVWWLYVYSKRIW